KSNGPGTGLIMDLGLGKVFGRVTRSLWAGSRSIREKVQLKRHSADLGHHLGNQGVRTSRHTCPVIYWQSCVRYLASIPDDRLHCSLILNFDRLNQIVRFSFRCFESSSLRIMCKLSLYSRARVFFSSKSIYL